MSNGKPLGGLKEYWHFFFTFVQGHSGCYFGEVPSRINNSKRETNEGATLVIQERGQGLAGLVVVEVVVGGQTWDVF